MHERRLQGCGGRAAVASFSAAWLALVVLLAGLLPGAAAAPVMAAGIRARPAVVGAVTVGSAMPRQCRRPGFTICVNKNARLLYALRSGRIVKVMAARFGSSSYPTRNGQFWVQWKSRYHYSSRYHSAMPFSLFFSGGQAIHYSSNFARVGYDGASHGCINLRSWSGAEWLFDNARVGTPVYVGRW